MRPTIIIVPYYLFFRIAAFTICAGYLGNECSKINASATGARQTDHPIGPVGA